MTLSRLLGYTHDKSRRGIPAGDIYGEIGELTTGAKPGRESDEEVTIFKSVGLSIQDISAAHYVYGRALEEGAGTDFAFS